MSAWPNHSWFWATIISLKSMTTTEMSFVPFGSVTLVGYLKVILILLKNSNSLVNVSLSLPHYKYRPQYRLTSNLSMWPLCPIDNIHGLACPCSIVWPGRADNAKNWRDQFLAVDAYTLDEWNVCQRHNMAWPARMYVYIREKYVRAIYMYICAWRSGDVLRDLLHCRLSVRLNRLYIQISTRVLM